MKHFLAASALLCFVAGAMAQPARTERAAVANGESVYLARGCPACHGTVGHGGAARRLAPDTLPLPAFTAWVRNGTPGWSFAAGMPAFPPSVISDADLAAQLSGWAQAGIHAVKMKVGRQADDDPHRVEVARRAIGDEVQLFVDANGAYSRKQALRLAE